MARIVMTPVGVAALLGALLCRVGFRAWPLQLGARWAQADSFAPGQRDSGIARGSSILAAPGAQRAKAFTRQPGPEPQPDESKAAAPVARFTKPPSSDSRTAVPVGPDHRLFPSLPVPCRDDLAAVAEKYFRRPGGATAAEIGVFRGDFAAKNLRRWTGRYYMIDAWSFRPGDPGDKNFRGERQNEDNYNSSKTKTAFASDRRQLIRSLSQPAAAQFEDGFFDWVYIDALHTTAALLADLEAWYPKVRPGGLISGDDYGDRADTELVPARRWTRNFGGVAAMPQNAWGVISAVNKFTRARGLQVHVTWMHDCYKFAAWYFTKPL